MTGVRFASRVRRDNMQLRLIEVPLSRARTAAEAAAVIDRLFPPTPPRGK